jgi:ribonuclease P protein component
VKRNRVKRQLREAYRKNKDLLCAAQPPKRVLAFLWLSDRLYETGKVETAMKTLLLKISEHYSETANDGQS